MRDYCIVTESTCDLPQDYIDAHGLTIFPLYYMLGEQVFGGEETLTPKEFYDRMRGGDTPTTMASNPDNIKKSYQEILSSGKDILHISFSSALSGSCSNAMFVAKDMADAHPEAQIVVIDSLCASMGQGLLVHKAVELKESGRSLEEVREWLEDNKLHLCHQFTVEDLNYLQRGGRIKKSVAVLGTLINVKPVLHVDNEGRLVPLNNVRGRKKSLLSLVENMAGQVGDFENDAVFISHGDSLEDAEFVRDQVKERFPDVKTFVLNYVSPTIGAHSGPGTIALFYMGKER